jgi:hypothetical protein
MRNTHSEGIKGFAARNGNSGLQILLFPTPKGLKKNSLSQYKLSK